MKIGIQLGYWGRTPPADLAADARGGRRPRLRLGVGGRVVGQRRVHLRGVGRRRTPTIKHRHRRRAAGGPHADGARRWRPSPSTTSPTAASSSASACPARRSSRAGTASPSNKPLARTREYVDIIRRALRREGPLDVRRRVLPAPVPRRGQRRARQAAEDHDPPAARATSRSSSAPRARRTSPRPPRSPTAGCRSTTRRTARRSTPTSSPDAKPGFEITGAGQHQRHRRRRTPGCCPVKAMLGFYIGGMGAKGQNYHTKLMQRMGFEEEALQDPGALLRGQARRGDHGRARRVRRRDLARRSAGAHQGAARAVAREPGHQLAGRGPRPAIITTDRRSGPELTPPAQPGHSD